MENNIELIKSRLFKATKGKWQWIQDEKDECVMPMVLSDGEIIMDFGDCETYYPTQGTPPNEYDADFIINAKSDIEYLLKENDSLKSSIKAVISFLENEIKNK